jgi:hypothetical protein
MSKAKPIQRCEHCGKRASDDGPLPYAWDHHTRFTREMFATCSPACRVALGLRERKVGAA